MKFQVPYNGTPNFIAEVVRPFEEHIGSVYFSLPSVIAGAGRTLVTSGEYVPALVEKLAELGIESVALLNQAYTGLDGYTDAYLSRLIDYLKFINPDMLCVNNNYLVNLGIFERYYPQLKLEASINQQIRTRDKVDMLVKYLGYKSLVLDRYLNKDMDALNDLTTYCKETYPDVTLKVVANEGCLLECPFKKDHDNLISNMSYYEPHYMEYVNTVFKENPELETLVPDINNYGGCLALVRKFPELANSVPKLSYEDLELLKNVDQVKLAGRTHPNETIRKTLDYYVNGVGSATSVMDCGFWKEPAKEATTDVLA